MKRLLLSSLVLLIRAYRLLLSPLLGSGCRFYPSCSEYTLGSVASRPVAVPVLYGGRVGSCHPWHAGGFDPVP